MKRTGLFLLLILLFIKTYGQHMEKVFLDDHDTTKNYYTTISPNKHYLTGYLVLIPGFGETPKQVMQQTNLPLLAAQAGILTIIPTLQDGTTSFGVDSASQQSLAKIIEHITGRVKLIDRPFYIGGFSLGGSAAIKYAENIAVKPAAVFAIDPPLDFERFYNSAQRDIRLSGKGQLNQENVYMVKRIEEIMGGTPERALANYHQISPYSYSDTSQTAIKGLVHTPVRIYSEPDVNWWIKNRGADFTAMNVTDDSAMINELTRLGNKKATLIITQNKGFRQPGNKRHPHSWSIAESAELIKWLLLQH